MSDAVPPHAERDYETWQDSGPARRDVGSDAFIAPTLTCTITRPRADDRPTNRRSIQVEVRITSSSERIDGIDVFVRGVRVELDEEGTGAVTLDVVEGAQSIELTARHAGGTECRSEVIVLIDHTPPRVSLDEPSGDVVFTRARSLVVRGCVYAGGPLGSVDLSVSPPRPETPVMELRPPCFSGEVIVSDGVNQVALIIADEAGNFIGPFFFEVVSDRFPPEVVLETWTREGDLVEVLGRVFEPDGIPPQHVLLDIIAESTTSGERLVSGPYSSDEDGRFRAGGVRLYPGENQLTVCGDDRGGNRACSGSVLVAALP